MNILVIDTKLMMYKQHHSRKPPLAFLEKVASLSLKLLPHINKVIFAKDVGKSKRCEIFPDYKSKRLDTQKKMSSAESARLAEFLSLYNRCDDFLKHFGSVIALDGIEADDIASMVAERKGGGTTHVWLLSGDEDWSRFLVNENTYMVHPQREKIITTKNAKKEFKVHPQHKLIIDSVTGVDKESVDGIKNLGKGRAVNVFEESQHDLELFLGNLDEGIAKKRFGMQLPDWAKSAKDVYERNSKIFATHTFEELSPEEKELFIESWANVPSRDFHDILRTSSFDLEVPFLPNNDVTKFFKIVGN